MRYVEKICLFIALVVVASSMVSFAVASDASYQKGREIMEEVDARNRFDNETTKVKMEIIDSRAKVRIRRLTNYTKRDVSDNLKIIIRFLSPKDVKGTGLLTIEHSGREDDQWLYLPILRKNKRIAGNSKRNSFVGTDFTFEDLRPEDLDTHDYKFIRYEELDDKLCFVIEATPTKEEEKYSGYKRRMIWIRKDIYLPIKVDYIGKNDKLLKTETRSRTVEVKPGLWRSNFILMDNHQKNHKTTLDIQSRDVDSQIADSKFTQIELERGWQ